MTPDIAAKKIITPMTMPKFTFVVRLCTFTSGSPELSFSIDMTPRDGPRVPSAVPGITPRAFNLRNLRLPKPDTQSETRLLALDRRHPSEVKPFLVFEPIRRATRSQQGDDDSTDQCGRSNQDQDDDRNGHDIR